MRATSFLPRLAGDLYLTDGGLESTLVFHDGLDLPCFAAFPLLDDEGGRARLRRYFERYVAIAVAERRGIVLETPTWRANRDWGARLGYDTPALDRINRLAVRELLDLRARHATPATPIVVSGNLGPRGDGYRPESAMTVAEAADYHLPQIDSLVDAGADMIAAFTMNYIAEAAGIAVAAASKGRPYVLSFTVETDGRLPSGESLREAIETIDELARGVPEYYMINCAHPSHFAHVLAELGPLAGRIGGIRANASRLSHAELDACTTLDDGDPAELGADYRRLRTLLPNLAVVGGCCGTDHRHVAAIAAALRPIASAA